MGSLPSFILHDEMSLISPRWHEGRTAGKVIDRRTRPNGKIDIIESLPWRARPAVTDETNQPAALCSTKCGKWDMKQRRDFTPFPLRCKNMTPPNIGSTKDGKEEVNSSCWGVLWVDRGQSVEPDLFYS